MKNFISLIFLTLSFLTYSQNVAPTVADATATITEGATGQSINVTVSDDDSGDTWTLSVVSAPSVGTTVTVNWEIYHLPTIMTVRKVMKLHLPIEQLMIKTMKVQ
jgi:hypothetical protein